MYCRKCGKPVENGDAFCTYCGTPIPVRTGSEPAEKISEEPVRRTAAAYNPEFKWNNSEFNHPPRKTEDINFDWTKGTNMPRHDTLEVQPAYPEHPAYPERPTYPQPERDERPADRYETVPQGENRKYESELFRDTESADREERIRREEKFHTFMMKNEEFQKLLDREYERIRRNGNPIERPQPASSLFGDAPSPEIVPEQTKPLVEETPIQTHEEPAMRSEETETRELNRFFRKSKAEEAEKTQEIRTIWEEIKADLEREARENQAKQALEAEEMRKNTQVIQAAALTEAAKAWSEVKPQESEAANTREEANPAKPQNESATPTDDPTSTPAESNPDDAELAAAEALKKMWANMATEEEKEPKKVSGWLIFFLILVVLGLLVAAGIGVQKWAPDTDVAAWCEKAEDWLIESWDSLVEAVKNVFEK